MPRVTLKIARRAVVTRNNQNFRLQCRNLGHDRIEFFDASDLFREVTIFTRAIGVLEVDEEEIVRVPILFQDIDLLLQRLSLANNIHPDESRETFVHGINCNGCRSEAVNLLVARQ